ncbi:hypothetical protein, partial [Burkholderia cepacia]|uniref:hypothetical protein n=1 Tax=Burkholderia cepacia TaxID=292 RepID=UPI001C686838
YGVGGVPCERGVGNPDAGDTVAHGRVPHGVVKVARRWRHRSIVARRAAECPERRLNRYERKIRPTAAREIGYTTVTPRPACLFLPGPVRQSGARLFLIDESKKLTPANRSFYPTKQVHG